MSDGLSNYDIYLNTLTAIAKQISLPIQPMTVAEFDQAEAERVSRSWWTVRLEAVSQTGMSRLQHLLAQVCFLVTRCDFKLWTSWLARVKGWNRGTGLGVWRMWSMRTVLRGYAVARGWQTPGFEYPARTRDSALPEWRPYEQVGQGRAESMGR